MESQQTYLACWFCFPNVCHMMFSSKFTLETDLDQFQRLKESLPPDKIALEKKDAGRILRGQSMTLVVCCLVVPLYLKCIDIFSKHVKKKHKEI